MADYKGRQSVGATERHFPHFVDVTVPPGGLGSRLNAMYDFHTRNGIAPQRGQLARRRDGCGVIRWCFADPVMAGAFEKEFAPK